MDVVEKATGAGPGGDDGSEVLRCRSRGHGG